MKRKLFFIGAVMLGLLVLLLILAVPAAPLFQRLGVEPICIQGSWPDLKIVPCPQPAPAGQAITALPVQAGQPPIPIIVDDDGSPDGTIALLYFLGSPLFDVRAVTVSYGEAHPEVFADHLAQLLAGMEREDIPVGVGRANPLEGTNAFPEPWRENSDHFWGIALPPAAHAASPAPAAGLIVETISQSSQPVRVFVSGSHTNLAEALRLDPGIAQNIRDVIVMGGSIHEPGNIESDWPSIPNRVSEWNIWVDPVAASEVFNAGIPLSLIPLDATQRVVWTQTDAHGWLSSSSAEGVMAGKLLQWMLDTWSPRGVYVWDLVAAVQASNPSLCPEVAYAVEVVTIPGPEQGRTVLSEEVPNASVCLDPVQEKVKALAASILARR